MAYPNYQYPGYQPAPYYSGPMPDQLVQLRQNQMQQPVMQGPQIAQQGQQMQAQMPAANPIPGSASNGMIWVSGRQEADGYLIAPNNAVALWDANNPVVYLRKADSTGKPSTVVYDLVERTDDQRPEEKQIDLSGYMTREEFSAQVQDVVRDVVDEVLTERLKRPSRGAAKKEED